MFKDYWVKNPDMLKAFMSKIVTRVESDGDIPANRLVEKDASTGNIEVAGASSVRVIGANQDEAREDGDYFNAELGPVYVEASSPLVAGQNAKAGVSGKGVAFIDSGLAGSSIFAVDGAGFTNQPATDGITVVSSSADDTTQTVTVYGVDSGGAYITEDFALNGTTDVNSASSLWATVSGVIIDGVTAGDIEVSETSGGLEIVTLTAGTLSAGIETIADGYAYDAIANVVADGASTGDLIVVHEATDGASETNLVATLNGTTDVALGAASFKINTVMTGGVGSAVAVSGKVRSTEDDNKLTVGKVLVGADAGASAVINVV